MRHLLAPLLMLPAVTIAGQVTFEGYEAYYAALGDTLFKAAEAAALEPYAVTGSDALRFAWQGELNGLHHQIELRGGTLWIDGRKQSLKSARAFAGELTSRDDLGRGSTVYVASPWTCIENTPASASGTAVRHKSVFLIRRLDHAGLRAWKLPGLFASCLGIRDHHGEIRFDKVAYRYREGSDLPAGVLFKEYAIRPDGSFAATGQIRSASFAEPDNVYRLVLDDR